MGETTVCPECEQVWPEGQTCADAFHQLLAWEWEYQMQEVHHLLVLSYHLQHPSLYSVEGLRGAGAMLIAFAEAGLTPTDMRQRISRQVASGTRNYSITARIDSSGTYAYPVGWRMRIGDCLEAGPAEFYASIRAWAASILLALRETGNLDETPPSLLL